MQNAKTLLCNIKLEKKNQAKIRKFHLGGSGGELRFLEEFQPSDFEKLRRASPFNDVYGAHLCLSYNEFS